MKNSKTSLDDLTIYLSIYKKLKSLIPFQPKQIFFNPNSSQFENRTMLECLLLHVVVTEWSPDWRDHVPSSSPHPHPSSSEL